MFSKVSHISVIDEIAKGMEAAKMNGAYLELGIAKGACFNKVAPHFKSACAVDMNYESYDKVCKVMRKKGNSFYTGTTDDFFEKSPEAKKKYNMIFIDANHDYKYVKRDFNNSLEILADNGLILLHDTYPPNEKYVKHCKDAYKINDTIRMHKGFVRDEDDGYSGVISQALGSDDGYCIESVTLPFFYGITIVRKYKRHLAWQN